MKKCKWCNEHKSLENFNKHSKMLDGHLNKCKSCEKGYKKQYYKNNKDTVIKVAKKRNAENYKLAKRTQKYKDVRNASRRKRYAEDLEYKIHCILRSRLVSALNGSVKEYKTIDYLGCDIKQLKKYLESQFKDGMNWENWKHDIWHVDHIRPLASFNLSDEEQIKIACHYTNLQPLWAEENLRKGHDYDGSD